MLTLRLQDLGDLTPKEVRFALEYVKDFKPRRAAVVAGFSPDSGYSILKKDRVTAAVEKLVDHQIEKACIDAAWVLESAVDVYRISLQENKMPSAIQALTLVAKHAGVDAFAAEKVMVASDEAVMARLQRGRARMNQAAAEPEKPEEVSFL